MKIEKITEKMNQEKLESLFILKPENIAYVTGFKPSSASILIIKEEPLLFSTKLDMELAQSQSCVPVTEFTSLDELKKSLKETLKGKMGIENSMSVGTYKKICQDFETVPNDIVESLRVFKSKSEINKIEGAIRIAEDSFEDVDLSEFSGSEDELAAKLEYNMRKAGSVRPAFETIAASGPRSSNPHASSTSSKLEHPVMIDWGAFYHNYASDITRSIVQSPKEEEILSILLDAQKETIKSIKPGVEASYVDEVARSVIQEYGYGEYFIHSTGHGVGLEVHEKPSLSSRSKEKLEKGMVVTVEPGIYLEGKFGLRVEDMVLIKNRAKILTNLPRKILSKTP
ncbi:MAG: Xaa-Pro dipeptidase [Methanobacterium sp. PtaB.Bin024]|jgi:Xaa-Pro dipeptidase|nr:MAG: Xaa-Pro dipeptidase [Methanobacterium sp. PtaB.Bin024]